MKNEKRAKFLFTGKRVQIAVLAAILFIACGGLYDLYSAGGYVWSQIQNGDGQLLQINAPFGLGVTLPPGKLHGF